MTVFDLELGTCWKKNFIHKKLLLFSLRTDSYLLQLIRKDKIQNDILENIFLFSLESDITSCY